MDERELAVGRHLARWGGHTHITSVASTRPWAIGGEALAIPIGNDPFAPSGRWFELLGRAVDPTRLRDAIAKAFAEPAEDFPRVRSIELPLLRPSRHSTPNLRVLLVRVDTVASTPEEIGDATMQAVLRADAMRLRTLALAIFADDTDEPARKRVAAMLRRIENLPPPVELHTVLLVATGIAAFAEVGERPLRPQAFANDGLDGEDLIDNTVEAGALAEMLMLRELEPPLVVGVIGGWGSGKSFALQLIAERIRKIRSLPVDAKMAWAEDPEHAFTYVGHIYTVRFDAWTFAKADLWSSLMGTIFDELERQLTLEQQLATAICPARKGDSEAVTAEQRREKIRLGGPLWGILSALDPAEQHRYLVHLTEDEQAELQRLASEGGGELWTELRRRTEEKRKALEEHERELEKLRADAERRKGELVQQLNEEEAWRTYGALLRAKAGKLFERTREILSNKVREDGSIDAEFSIGERLRAIPQLILQRPLEFAIVVGVVVLFGVLAALALAPQWRALVASITAAISAIGIYIHAGRTLLGQLFERYGEYQSMVEQVSVVHTEARVVRRKEVFDKDGALKELESKVVAVETTVVKARADLVLGEFGSVHEFLQARIDGGGYAGGLGPLAGVQADLLELSRALASREIDNDRLRSLFPRGPARVALFIDDLDRCPPDRVVEVLEATQLLLKTRLFVVVLALDVRYVSRALERVYQGVLSRLGAPSGLDYIEKIIQIPYRVPVLDAESFAEYLRGQVLIAPVEDDAVPRPVDPLRDESKPPGRQGRIRRDAALRHPTDPDQRLQWQQLPTKLLQLTVAEAERLQRCAGGLGLSPRGAKRLINVYKLLKIIWTREPNRRPRDGEEDAIVALLALACAWPHPMREVFAFLEARVFQRPGMQLREVVGMLARACARSPWQEQAWARAAAAALEVLPAVRIEELSPDAVATAQMFSFVGDIGYDPGDGTHGGYFDPDALPVPAAGASRAGTTSAGAKDRPRGTVEW
ncbi:MAG TPA: P-loop NTPase fold protein [Nannocystaceae bacterium]|nr:P-loop NTPase fold protein [Nannocystaceae bacterium]